MLLNVFRSIFDWSEVWALFLPLAILFKYKPKKDWVKPVIIYLFIALVLNIVIDFMWYVNKNNWFDSRPGDRWNNNILYNLQSVNRLFLFSWFFSTLGDHFKKITRLLPAIFLISSLIYFSFFNSFLVISSYLMAMEAGFLLIYCLWFTYTLIKEDQLHSIISHNCYWVIGGLTIYTSVSFFIFLFYNYLMNHYKEYSVSLWDIHNVLFMILCVSISIAFYYESDRN